MYIFIENNNTKKGKNKRKKGKKSWVGLEPGTFGSTRVHLTTAPQRLTSYLGEKSLISGLSMKLPPAN